MASEKNVKKRVLGKARKSAEAAKQQLDQVILKLEHPALKKVSEKIKSAEPKDLIYTLAQKIIERAESIRASLKADARGTLVKATRSAGRTASGLAKKTGRLAKKTGQMARRRNKKNSKKSAAKDGAKASTSSAAKKSNLKNSSKEGSKA